MLMKEALQRYFAENQFGADGGYAASFVDVTVGPVVIHMPNTEQRKRAVRFHDLHHVITGYRTNLAGELEISGWEIGGHCRGFVAAWFLNLLGMLAGMVVNPRDVFRAFVRGLRSSTLYHLDYEALLNRTVDEVRAEMKLDDSEAPATVLETARFVAAIGLATVLALLTIPLVLNPLTGLVWLFTYRAWKVAQAQAQAQA